MRPTLLAVLLLAFPSAAVELSYFEPSGKACVWSRVERPDDREAARAVKFPAACLGMGIAWDRTGTKALMLFREPLQLFEVDVSTNERRPLPVPLTGEVDEVGYDSRGRVVALTVQDFAEREAMVFEGTRYEPGTGIGWPALTHGWALENGRWLRLETRVTGTSACGAPGARVLATWDAIVRPAAAFQRDVTAAEKERLDALSPLPVDPDGQWLKVGDLFAWHSVFGESFRPTGRLAIEVGGRLRLVETGFTASEPLRLEARRDVVLISTFSERARLIDLQSGAVVFSSDGVFAAELR